MEKRYLLKLVSSELTGNAPEIENCDYAKLFKVAVKQQAHPLLFSVLDKHDEDFKSYEDYTKWKNVFTTSCFKYAIFFNKINNILSVLDQKMVPVTMLKGSIYRELYPIAELRTMGDIDLLVPKESISVFIDTVKEFGYEREENQGHLEEIGYEFKSNDGLPGMEAFFSLKEDFRARYDEKYEKDTIPYKNFKNIVKLTDLSATVHHIAHFAKHFYTRGAGIRFLLDLYLLLSKQDNLDRNALSEEMKSLGLYKFFSVSVCVLKKYFSFSPDFEHENLSEQVEPFLDYLMRDSVYGNKESSGIVKRELKKRGKFGMIMRTAFPDVEFLCTKYPFFKKRKWLLPIAWLRHVFSIITSPGKVKKNLKYIAGKEATKDAELFKSLDD